jgi:hypothetical protein
MRFLRWLSQVRFLRWLSRVVITNADAEARETPEPEETTTAEV